MFNSLPIAFNKENIKVEWWLEHKHSWLVKRQWAGSGLGRVTHNDYQVLGSTSIPARLDTLVYWESFSWLTSVGTTRNTVSRLGWSRIGLAVLILHAAGAGLIGRPIVISGRYNKCHSLQQQNHYAHFPPLQHTRMQNTTMRNGSWEMIMCFEALCAGRGRRNPVWSGKETPGSILVRHQAITWTYIDPSSNVFWNIYLGAVSQNVIMA